MELITKIAVAAFNDELEKLARSYGDDFMAGIDPTGTTTMKYGYKDALDRRDPKDSRRRRGIGVAGGLIGGAALVPSALMATLNTAGAIRGKRGLVGAAKAFGKGLKDPYTTLYHGIRGRSAIKHARKTLPKKGTELKDITSLRKLQEAGAAAPPAVSKKQHGRLGSLGKVVAESTGKDPKLMNSAVMNKALHSGGAPMADQMDRTLRSQLSTAGGGMVLGGGIGGASAYRQYGAAHDIGKRVREGGQ